MMKGLPLVMLIVGSASCQMVLNSSVFPYPETVDVDLNDTIRAGTIPYKYACDKDQRDAYRPSPPLNWEKAPAKVQSYILIVDDFGTTMPEGRSLVDSLNADKSALSEQSAFDVLWAVKDIPRTVTSIADDASESDMPEGSTELANSYGVEASYGPCPLEEQRLYRYRLFAMPAAHTDLVSTGAGMKSDYLTNQIEKQALYVATLMGTINLPKPDQRNRAAAASKAMHKLHLMQNRESQQAAASKAMHKVNMLTDTGKSDCDAGTVSLGDVDVSYPALTGGSTADLTCAEAMGSDWSGSGVQITCSSGTASLTFGDCENDSPIVGSNQIEDSSEYTKAVADPMAMNRTYRVIKPSEVLKVGMTNFSQAKRSRSALEPECTEANATSCDVQLLQVGAKSKDAGLWECESKHQHHQGMRMIKGQMERCSMRVRVIDAPCEHPTLPAQFGCYVGNPQSPSLMWKDAPEGTKSFIVMMEDGRTTDSKEDRVVHWLVFDIPYHVSSIEAGASPLAMPPLSSEHRNSFNETGYVPPCPRKGHEQAHQFRMRVFAMPHATTDAWLPGRINAALVTETLMSKALCVASTTLPLSAQAMALKHTDVHARATDEIVPGEMQPVIL